MTEPTDTRASAAVVEERTFAVLCDVQGVLLGYVRGVNSTRSVERIEGHIRAILVGVRDRHPLE